MTTDERSVTPMRGIDHPRIRETVVCPLCHKQKGKGLVTCWPCYREYRLRYGNENAEALIDEEERRLES